jgi:elongation factor Tu
MPVFRTVAPFLRTARSVLQTTSVSPLLRSRAGASVLNGARTYAAVFERTKPHVNIGVYYLDLESWACINFCRHNWSR